MSNKFKSSLLQNKKLGYIVLACSGSFGLGVLYLENQTLKNRLRVVNRVTLQDKPDGYIYVPTNQGEKRSTGTKKELFPWLKSRSHDPKTLLSLAQSEDHAVRLLGVNALAQPHKWLNSDYRMLAQALGSAALIGLARMPNADERFFLPQPALPPVEECIEDQLRKLISALPMDNLDQCTKYFTSSALQEGNQSKKEERGGLWCFGGNGLAFTESLSPVPIEIVEIFCLQAIEKHSILPSHCTKIVQHGGLAVFQRIYESRPNNIKILRSMARIMANLAVHENLHAEITKTGWITVLHKWLNSKDLALSLYAAKALANLDLDFGGTKKYVDGVYLYYPQKRYSEPVYADVVFVHGLMGGPFRTWRQDDSVLHKLREQRKLRQSQSNGSGKPVENLSGNSKVQHKAKADISKITETANSVHADQTYLNKNTGKSGSDDTSDRNNKTTLNNKNTDDTNNSRSIDSNSETKSSVNTTDRSVGKVKQILDLNKFNIATLDTREIFSRKESTKIISDDIKKRIPYTFCWPKDWLPDDEPHIRILTVEYDTHLSEWAPKCPYQSEKRALATRSKELLEKLKEAGIGDRPVIWIGHSMGGLLIKQMLVNASNDLRYRNVVDKTHGIVFYSVPHKGSPLAAYGNIAKYLFYPSVEVKELKLDCPQLQSLHRHFKDLMFDTGVPVLSFAEGEKTDLPLNMKVVIVPEKSSDPGFGEFLLMKKLNHLNICKPVDDQSLVYQLTLQFLRDCLPLHRVPHILKATVPDEFVLSDDEVS